VAGRRERVLLSDAVPYTLKVVAALNRLCPRLIIYIFSHGLKGMAKLFQGNFPHVNNLFSGTEKVRDSFRMEVYRKVLLILEPTTLDQWRHELTLFCFNLTILMCKVIH
jgi:uncharacterized protein (DUF488 family)